MKSVGLLRLLRDACILALGVMVASVVDGIDYANTQTLVLVAVVMGLLNMLVRPVLILFALPFVVFTLGLGIWFINAALLYFAGALIQGFEVESFGTALLGSIFISLTGLVVNLFLPPRTKVRWQVRNGRVSGSIGSQPDGRPSLPKREKRDDDVIDV